MGKYDKEISAAKKAIDTWPDWLSAKPELCQDPNCIAARKEGIRLREGVESLENYAKEKKAQNSFNKIEPDWLICRIRKLLEGE